ncbi:MAG TPA: hypothetical protein VJ124_05285 [Pyrinomonadaceae bacterium]|nr:hypothetical protein [Pyrinomonadaceae bacterium]
MPRADYNSDREGHAEHKWEVIRATRRDLPSLDVDGKQMNFGKDGAFRVNDEGVAAAIREEYAKKGDVTVTRIRYPGEHDRGHRYFFGQLPEMPWKENGNGETEAEENAEGYAHDERQDDVGRRHGRHDAPEGDA